MTKRVLFVSRDKRTAHLFRGTWEIAASQLGYSFVHAYRRGELLKILVYMTLNRSGIYKSVIFGSADIILLAPFKPNILVFTGLGRLLDKQSRSRKVLFRWLKLWNIDRKIVCLNKDDYRIFSALGFQKTKWIRGEGVSVNVARQYKEVRGGDFLYVGRLLKSKGLEDILQAFLSANLKGPRLVIIGDRDFNNSDSFTEREICEYHQLGEGNIMFIPFQKRLTEYRNPAATYVSASRREGMPFAVVEALAVGMRAFLSRVPGHKDLEHLEDVVLFKNRQELANLMKLSSVQSPVNRPAREGVQVFLRDGVIPEIQKLLL